MQILACTSLTVMLTVVIQREIVLSVAKFLRSACNEDVVVAKEILEAGNL